MSKQNLTKLFLDLAAFIALLIVCAPRFTGVAIHEWLAIALSGTIVVHLLLNWNWIIQISSRLFSKSTNNSRFGYFLNWGLFASGIMIMLSGLMISETVVPFLGFSLQQDRTWMGLHELSTNITMILMGLHVALHWSWITSMFKRLLAPRSLPQVVSTPAFNTLQRKDA